MGKYPIKKEFFPFNILVPPIKDIESAGKLGKMMKPPKWLWKDKEISVERKTVSGCNGEPIEVFVMKPEALKTDNCLVYFHGGGFVFEGAGYHYRNAKAYALGVPCKVIFVQYRLSPQFSYSVQAEDCYEALKWTYCNAKALEINKEKIAVGGDSAGACLAAAVAQMARDRELDIKIKFQLLLYPFLDPSMDSDSNRRFTDTPMWNSTLSKKVALPVENVHPYASPMAVSVKELPQAYIETAEFDCLHDDGINYANKLTSENIPVTLNETKGTMHGFDIAWKAPTAKEAVKSRITYMHKAFI